ncbi:Salicylate carboxymethyltransferase [Dichanthelium oligosanthes]|uniref:Salicylate carboxymethyltransferase n=1 Tax=Dichanthelium oligosanthes TaxID=888268 RepID=A0A1E5WIA6_9POAL|nr:Salicylate carboxymethyltransferase [Dichanthelium oligosanthes]
MSGGDGETSYAKNSAIQSGVQSRLKPLVEGAISDLCGGTAVPRCLRVADLGCSSGPNALALVSAAVDAVRRQPSVVAERRCREVCVYLNDLPGNDFNTVVKDVPSFLREHENVESGGGGGDGGPLVMVFGAPGSFYGRLFPAETLHLVCSSFSLHWLSQVPQELVDGVLVNKGSVSAGRTSAPAVAPAVQPTPSALRDTL